VTIIDVDPKRMQALSAEVVVKSKDLRARVEAFTGNLKSLQWTDEDSRPVFEKRKTDWEVASDDTGVKLQRLGDKVAEIAQRYTKMEAKLGQIWLA
jgi:hypothetical protein